MKRVGYDSDTGRYHYRGLDGSLWEGPEGAEFGENPQVSIYCLGLFPPPLRLTFLGFHRRIWFEERRK